MKVIRFLASPETMRTALKKIDFDCQWVTHIETRKNELNLFFSGNDGKVSCVKIRAEHDFGEGYMKQGNPRWDWVKQLMSEVKSQPISFSITEERINLLFQY